MTARGKVPKEVQAIFEKYQETNVRRLHKPEALQLLRNEFNLTEDQALNMFETFDKDKNEMMSIWEFQQFFQTIGRQAEQMVKKFLELDVDKSGKLDKEEARAGLKEVTVEGDQKLDDKEIDFFIQSSLGDDDLIDLGHFCSLLYRLKVYKPPKRPSKT